MRKHRIINVVVVITLIGAIAVAAYLYLGHAENDQGEAYLTVPVSRGNLSRTVSSTGLLQAVVTVQVGSQVSGRIKELHADFNSVVKKGQTLAVIDPANFEAQLERSKASVATAKASVMSAQANLVNRQAELESSKANVKVSEVNLKEAEREWNRSKELYEAKVISDRDLENAQAGLDASQARLVQAQAQVSQVEASIRSAHAQNDQAKANVKEARAGLKLAEVNLHYTNITSPINGVVIERNVDIGQTVAASFQAPVLFLIANDLSKMQVIAQIDEADIGAISETAQVNFSVDAFSRQVFEGNISEIRLSSKLPNTSSGQAVGATNVVVYNVIIDVNNNQLKLRPAMTANVNFIVAHKDNVLKVANSALRFRPEGITPKEILELIKSDNEPGPGSGDGSAIASPRNKRNKGSKPRTSGTRPNWNRQDNQRKIGQEKNQDEQDPNTDKRVRPVVGLSSIEQYGIRPGPKIRFPHAELSRPRPSLIWVLNEQREPDPRRVILGITDGKETAILSGDLDEGEKVITWKLDESGEVQRSASPFSGAFGPRRNRSSSRSSSGRRSGSRSGGR